MNDEFMFGMQTSEDPLSKETWKIWKEAFDQLGASHERAYQALDLVQEVLRELEEGPYLSITLREKLRKVAEE